MIDSLVGEGRVCRFKRNADEPLRSYGFIDSSDGEKVWFSAKYATYNPVRVGDHVRYVLHPAKPKYWLGPSPPAHPARRVELIEREEEN